MEACKEHRHDSDEYAKTAKNVEGMSHTYVQALFCCYGQPLSFLQGLEPKGLNKALNKVLGRKRLLKFSLDKDMAGFSSVPLKKAKTVEKMATEVLPGLSTLAKQKVDTTPEGPSPSKGSSEAH